GGMVEVRQENAFLDVVFYDPPAGRWRPTRPEGGGLELAQTGDTKRNTAVHLAGDGGATPRHDAFEYHVGDPGLMENPVAHLLFSDDPRPA
ncbi:MAG TPA: hypothetical protein VFN52_06530, partial [Acidiferrobacteraceae bacterium]|nr:hypothetical protein [Acidiferrobacteraceae bacterium]